MSLHEKSGTNAASGAAAPGDVQHHFERALAALDREAAPIIGQWTPARQVTFLNAIASGATVLQAAETTGVTARSAYMFRKRPEGAAFAVGWQAAGLLARDVLHDMLYDRVVTGQTWTAERDDGERVVRTTRHRHDNRLALSMLARLDGMATDSSAPDVNAGRLIVGHFDSYLAYMAGGANVDDVFDFMLGARRAEQQTQQRVAERLADDDDDDDDDADGDHADDSEIDHDQPQ